MYGSNRSVFWHSIELWAICTRRALICPGFCVTRRFPSSWFHWKYKMSFPPYILPNIFFSCQCVTSFVLALLNLVWGCSYLTSRNSGSIIQYLQVRITGFCAPSRHLEVRRFPIAWGVNNSCFQIFLVLVTHFSTSIFLSATFFFCHSSFPWIIILHMTITHSSIYERRIKSAFCLLYSLPQKLVFYIPSLGKP